MINYLKKVDIFGHPIRVNYKGETAHNTIFGSVLSLVMITWVLFYAVYTFLDTFEHLNQEVNTNRIKADLDEQGAIDLGELNF